MKKRYTAAIFALIQKVASVRFGQSRGAGICVVYAQVMRFGRRWMRHLTYTSGEPIHNTIHQEFVESDRGGKMRYGGIAGQPVKPGKQSASVFECLFVACSVRAGARLVEKKLCLHIAHWIVFAASLALSWLSLHNASSLLCRFLQILGGLYCE